MTQRTNLCIYFAALLLVACATNGGESREGLSMEEAVELSSAAITEKLPAGTRVAIVAFEAEHENLAGYIMDELTGALVDGRLEVADRNNLPYALKELNFQVSGMVDDESAAGIGKFLGAAYVITGQLVNTGSTYRYRLAAVNAESAVQEVSQRYTVRNDRAARNLVAALQNNKQVTRAAKYAVTEETTPQTAGTFLDRGIMFVGRGDYEMAIKELTESIKLGPNEAAAYYLRGYAYGEKGKYDSAIADYNQAIKLNPNYAAAYNNRGMAYNNKGDFDRAITDYTQAIKLNPNDTGAYYNRGTTYGQKGIYDQAITDLNQAIKLDPNYANAYGNRGIAHGLKGDYDHAIADYTKAIKLDPDNANTYNNRGIEYFEKGDYDRAITDYTQAIKLNPNYADAYGGRGAAYHKKGQKTQAIQDLEKAISLDPNLIWEENLLREIQRR